MENQNTNYAQELIAIPIKVEVNRDKGGFPSQVIITDRGKLTVRYRHDQGIEFSRRPKPSDINILKLLFPFAEKEESEEYDSKDMATEETFIAGAATTVIYTVPAGKKMKILLMCHTTSLNSVAKKLVASQSYLEPPDGGASNTLLFQSGMIQSLGSVITNSNKLDMWIPAGWSIRVFTDEALQYTAFSFIGVLKNA